MSKELSLNCPNCKAKMNVAEELSKLPAACPSCQSVLVPADVIKASNDKFSMKMYAGMFLIGIGILVYLGMTGQLKEIMEKENARKKTAAEAKADVEVKASE